MNIVYFPLGNETIASSRLRVHKVIPHLRSRGHRVWIDADPDQVDADVVVVQKRHDLGRSMRRWIENDRLVVYDLADREARLEPHSALTVSTAELQRQVGGSVVPDCLDITPGAAAKIRHRDRLETVAWCGLGCNVYHADPVWRACRDLGLRLVIVTDLGGRHQFPRWDGAEYRRWDLETVDAELADCDVLACPYVRGGRWPWDWTRCKSANRVLKGWALGLPVVGTGIPSYRRVGLDLLAETPDQWRERLAELTDRRARERSVEGKREYALMFDAGNVATVWLRTFERLLSERKVAT